LTDQPDDPVDLSPLRSDLDARVERVTARVMDRIASTHRPTVVAEVLYLVGRWAWPTALAAAASIAMIMTRQDRRPVTEPFAALVMSESPAVRWVAEGDLPQVGELLNLTRGQ
jgi:hypothetical protein